MKEAVILGLHVLDQKEDSWAGHAWVSVTRFKLTRGGGIIGLPGIDIKTETYGLWPDEEVKKEGWDIRIDWEKKYGYDTGKVKTVSRYYRLNNPRTILFENFMKTNRTWANTSYNCVSFVGEVARRIIKKEIKTSRKMFGLKIDTPSALKESLQLLNKKQTNSMFTPAFH